MIIGQLKYVTLTRPFVSKMESNMALLEAYRVSLVRCEVLTAVKMMMFF
jgi:hypothetical protein